MFSVRLHVFSGREDPTWEINTTHQHHATIKGHLQKVVQGKPLADNLGYRGFTVTVNKKEHAIQRGSLQVLERLLLSTKPQTSMSPDDVATHVMEYIHKPATSTSAGQVRKEVKPPPYEPEKWNKPDVIGKDNCYNYANNMQTNTFAQPGRASGQDITALTCQGVGPLAVLDGLVDVAADPYILPTPPPNNNLVALVIWPNTDYHWYRLDDTGTFSHKPGQTRVRDVDDSGNTIYDPRYCDRGPYTVFCRFMGTDPNTVKIS